MTSVYIVTRGSYSDYQIVSVHSLEEDAEVVASRIGGDVEDWEVDAQDIALYRHPWWRVRITSKGLGFCDPADGYDYQYEDLNVVTYRKPEPTRYPIFSFDGIDRFPWDQGHWEVYVQAPTKDHAKKIGQDVIAQHRASYLLDEDVLSSSKGSTPDDEHETGAGMG